MDPPSLASVGGEVMAAVAPPLPLARTGPRRTSVRTGLVFRLRLEHAPQRLPRAPRHAAERMACRARPWLPAALQPGRPSEGEGGAGEHLSRSRWRAVGRALPNHAA